MQAKRLIFHIDVNNAFLSWTAVYLLKQGYKQDIRNIPSIIGGDEKKRHGIVLAKSPVAKKMGIQTAETIYSARKKCRNLQVFPANYEWYKKESKILFQYLSQFTPEMERFSIDECFLDMTGTSLLYKDPIQLAYQIKEEIKQQFGFTVNIGIANNKLCAKMASDFEKPDKVHTLFQEEIETKMWPLKVSELFMVGKKSAEQLRQLGILTIGDLAKTDLNLLKRYFKSQGILMQQYARGIDESKVEQANAKNKCISVSRTLPYDYDDPVKLKKILLSEAEEVGRELRKQKEYAKTIAVTLKNSNFESYSHQIKLHNQTNATEVIYQTVIDLFDKVWRKDDIRNIGIRLSDFVANREKQVSLFDTVKEEKMDQMQEVMDQIKDKFGNESIMPASMISQENGSNK